jgi:hypothetical protein
MVSEEIREIPAQRRMSGSQLRAPEFTNTFLSETESAMSEILLESTLACPVCGFVKQEIMLTDACQYFYECSNCKTLLRPKPGDCCVFCSYGSKKCPPMQEEIAAVVLPNNSTLRQPLDPESG